MRCPRSTLPLRWLLLLTGLLLGGCQLGSAVFLNRGYAADDLVEEPSLEGRWARAYALQRLPPVEPGADEGGEESR